MKNRIDQSFGRLHKSGDKALIGYLMAGFPDKASLSKLIPLLEQAGIDILEIGVPFSDPIADGPMIQQASQVALKNGVTLDWVLTTVTTVRKKANLPIVLMSYSNPILAMGIDTFFRRARQSGVDGLIIPDLIPEESDPFDVAARREHVHLIYLVAPTTPSDRIRMISRRTRGFLYAVSLTGVTGARAALPAGLQEFLKSVKKVCRRPVAVGFGLSTRAQVAEAARHVDGVIVGSALVRHIQNSRRQHYRAAATYTAALKHALHSRKENNHAS